MKPQEITVAAGDGRAIRADLWTHRTGETLPLVIVCHGFLGYKRWGFFPYLSKRLAGAGFHVLTMSFSLNGVNEETGEITRPEEFAANTVSREMEDLERACAYARSRLLPVALTESGWGLLGHSRGGAVAILTASTLKEVESIVTWATPSRLDRYSEKRKRLWKREGAVTFTDQRSPAPLRLGYPYYEDIAANRQRYELPSRAAALTVPHLMIHGERDAAVSITEVRELVRLKRRSEAHLEIIRGCGHTFGTGHPMDRPAAVLEKAVTLSVDWFRRTLSRQ